MAFIQVGNAFINLEQVTVLDFDMPMGRPTLRVFGQGPQPIWEGQLQINPQVPHPVLQLKGATGATVFVAAVDSEGNPIT